MRIQYKSVKEFWDTISVLPSKTKVTDPVRRLLGFESEGTEHMIRLTLVKDMQGFEFKEELEKLLHINGK